MWTYRRKLAMMYLWIYSTSIVLSDQSFKSKVWPHHVVLQSNILWWTSTTLIHSWYEYWWTPSDFISCNHSIACTWFFLLMILINDPQLEVFPPSLLHIFLSCSELIYPGLHSVFIIDTLMLWTKWLPFCRQQFEMCFLNNKCIYFDLNFTDVQIGFSLASCC